MGWDRARERYASKMRSRGTPLMVTPEEFAAAARLLEKARAAGMSDRMIVEQTGVPVSLPSKVRRGRLRTMHRDTLERLAKLHPARPTVSFDSPRGRVGSGAMVSPVGTVRRIRALRRDGFPGQFLGERLGVSYQAVSKLAKESRVAVLESTRLTVAELYADLEGRRPEDFGVTRGAIGKCTTYAVRAGYEPRSCWDKHTIDDPAAVPQWTGMCGTPYGARIHRREGIPVCGPCKELDPGQRVAGFSGGRLRELREKRGLSLAELARRCGFTESHMLILWEKGKTKPTRGDRLELVLSVLDATFEDVCEEEQV